MTIFVKPESERLVEAELYVVDGGPNVRVKSPETKADLTGLIAFADSFSNVFTIEAHIKAEDFEEALYAACQKFGEQIFTVADFLYGAPVVGFSSVDMSVLARQKENTIVELSAIVNYYVGES